MRRQEEITREVLQMRAEAVKPVDAALYALVSEYGSVAMLRGVARQIMRSNLGWGDVELEASVERVVKRIRSEVALLNKDPDAAEKLLRPDISSKQTRGLQP